MFTGIVTDLGRVRSIEQAGDTRFVLETGYDTGTIAIGASIACSGACLTVVETGDDWFAVEASAETLGLTTLAAWRPGTRVNLERALSLGDELGGHLVTGHVDGRGEVLSIEPEGDSHRFAVAAPDSLARYIARKGSITVDGVSLTVNDVESNRNEGCRFEVNIIRHTAEATTFGTYRAGDQVNLEIDLLARYLERLVAKD